MSIDDIAKAEDKRLNNLVAITVVILTVFGAITKVKDDNINQAMQKAKADSVDAWAEYQFARVKLHVDENGLNQLRLLEIDRPGRARNSPPSRRPNTRPTSRNTKAARRRRAPRPRGSKPNTTG